jgi:hypothetical protein
MINRIKQSTAKIEAFTEQNHQQPRSGQNINGIFRVQIESQTKVVNLQGDGENNPEARKHIIYERYNVNPFEPIAVEDKYCTIFMEERFFA